MSSPTIKSAVAVNDAGTLVIHCLLENTGSKGMFQNRGGDYSAGTCYLISGMELADCIETTINPYISELWKRSGVDKAVSPMPSSACLAVYNCVSGDNCETFTCTAWSSTPNSTATNLPVGYALGVTPGTVKNLKATPGDKTITVTYDEPGNAPIFAYWIQVKVKATGSEIIAGWVNRRNVTVSNLVNGTTYTVTIRAISDDVLLGNPISVDATPVAPCPVPTCSYSVT